MSIYRTILEEELDIPILDDDNSPEIKEIEDIISDQDANGYEQDEAQAAEFGPSDGVEDIMDESFMAIAEAEIEFNKLMMAVGLHEVNESAAGREVLYEAVDIKGYIKKAKDWVVSFFKKVWQVLQRFAANISSAFHTNSGFAKKYGSQITEGYNLFKNDGKVKLKMYDYTGLASITAKDAWSDFTKSGAFKKINTELKDVISGWKKDGVGDTAEYNNEYKERTLKEFRSQLCGSECEAGEFREKMLVYLRGGEEKKEGKMPAKDVTDALTSQESIKKCKKAIDDSKKEYKKTISMLNELEKSLNRKIDKENNPGNSEKLGAVMRLTELFKGALSTTQVARAAILSCYHARMIQARTYGQAYVAAVNKNKYKGFQKESTEYGFLSNLSLV